MTQILIPSTDLLRTHEARHAVDQLLDALNRAGDIPTTGGDMLTIAGQRTATYGALIRIDHERFAQDGRGPAWATRWTTYTRPSDANAVLVRMLHEGREVYSVDAVRGALGGTTTR
jgi:hypothetical protein